jgi:4'-phosphopantetheinyl transferase
MKYLGIKNSTPYLPYPRNKLNNLTKPFNEFGKPFLGDDSRIQFNMSHSKDRAAYIISLDHQVGIDIEWKDKKIDISGVSKLVLTPAEVSSFNKLSLEERFNTFYNIWTKKEAIIKAIGQGLSYSIRKIEVMNSSSSKRKYYKSKNNKYYYLSLPALDNYVGAVTIAHKINKLIHLDMVTGVISCYRGEEQEWL